MIIASYCYGQRRFNEMSPKQQMISQGISITFGLTVCTSLYHNSYLNGNNSARQKRNVLFLMSSFALYSTFKSIPKESRIQLSKENIGLTYTF